MTEDMDTLFKRACEETRANIMRTDGLANKEKFVDILNDMLDGKEPDPEQTKDLDVLKLFKTIQESRKENSAKMIDDEIDTDELIYPRWMAADDRQCDHLYTSSFDSGYYHTTFCGSDDKMDMKSPRLTGKKCQSCTLELHRFFKEAVA